MSERKTLHIEANEKMSTARAKFFKEEVTVLMEKYRAEILRAADQGASRARLNYTTESKSSCFETERHTLTVLEMVINALEAEDLYVFDLDQSSSGFYLWVRWTEFELPNETVVV